MSKYWSVGVVVGVVFIALVIVSLNPNQNFFPNSQFKDLSGKAISGESPQYCAVTCDNTKKFIYSQASNPTQIYAYTIKEGDYFPVRAVSTSYIIDAVYRYDGLLFYNPKQISETSPFDTTDNYAKFSLIYAKITDVSTSNKNKVVYNFDCMGKQINVPLFGRTKYSGSNGDYGALLESFTNTYRFSEINLYPFEHAGLGNDPSYFGFHLRPFNRVAIITVGADPATGSALLVKESKLLVDLDGDGSLGGDSDIVSSTIGVCDQNVHTFEVSKYFA